MSVYKFRCICGKEVWDSRYQRCDRCGRLYCNFCIGACKVSGCMGWIRSA